MDKTTQIKREYIDVVYNLLCEEDFDKISIRHLATVTGRNSATLYYYFDDLRNLISIASIRYLTEYYETVSMVVNSHFNTLEINLHTWGCFAWYAFNNAPIYENFFLYDISKSEKALNEYLELYPEEKEFIKGYFLGETFYSLDLRMRDRWMLQKSAEEGMIASKSIDYLADFDFYLFSGMLSEIRHTKKDEKGIRDMLKKFLDIITETYRSQLLPGCSMLGCHLETIINNTV